jgi:hypothetical protein
VYPVAAASGKGTCRWSPPRTLRSTLTTLLIHLLRPSPSVHQQLSMAAAAPAPSSKLQHKTSSLSSPSRGQAFRLTSPPLPPPDLEGFQRTSITARPLPSHHPECTPFSNRICSSIHPSASSAFPLLTSIGHRQVLSATAKNWSSIERGQKMLQKVQAEKRSKQEELRAKAQKKERLSAACCLMYRFRY